jgi:hypothetical protein
MEPHAAEGRPGFWPTCLAVFVAGWVGGFAAGLLWGFFGTYGSAVQVLRGFGETPGTGSPLDSILIALVGPTVLRAVVGAVVLPSVLRWATGAEVSRLVAGLALGVGGLVAAGGWYALARSGAIMTPGYSFVPTVVGFLVSVAFVRALVGRRRRPEGETSRLKAFALVAGAPLAILLIGVLVLSGFARDGAGGGRVERGAYQAATLKAERIFVRSYRAAAALDSGGLGSGGILDQAQTELRSAAAELEEVRRGRKPVWTTRTIFSSPAWRPSPTTSTRWARIRPPRCRTQRRSEASARRSSTSTQRATDPGAWELAG